MGRVIDECNYQGIKPHEKLEVEAVPNTFFAVDDTLGAIRLTFGTEGYIPVDLDQTQVDQMNALNGVSPAQVKAAVSCAMFNCWENFQKIMGHNEWLGRK